MARLMTEFKSTKPNPDEKHLKALWQAEIKCLKSSLAAEKETAQRKKTNVLPVVKGSGLKQADITKLLEKGKSLSQKSQKAAERLMTKPAVNVDLLHRQDLKLAKANAKLMNPRGNPSWSGYIWNPSYGGWWKSWNGESEEVPIISFNFGAKRFDPQAQAWGEGWYDGDWSKLHGYFAYKFNPPSWGHLHIYTYPWLHGYYNMYSDDEWYNSEYARADLHTWVDAYQHFWRARQYRLIFRRGGDELHPTQYGRIDGQYGNSYYANVGASDTVTIRVGVHLYCYARASGGRSKLDFRSGAANYVHIPYVYWYLHH